MTKKRAIGEGSVYKTRDGRVIGSWQDANGKTRYTTSKTMTKREMSKAARKKLQDRDEGIVAHSEGLTVERYMDRWLESSPRGCVRARLSAWDNGGYSKGIGYPTETLGPHPQTIKTKSKLITTPNTDTPNSEP